MKLSTKLVQGISKLTGSDATYSDEVIEALDAVLKKMDRENGFFNGKPKWTPGPWSLVNQAIVGQGENVAAIFPLPADGESQANSTLIAAAPDMYDVLVEVKEHFDEEGGEGDGLSSKNRIISTLVDEIVEKARGG